MVHCGWTRSASRSTASTRRKSFARRRTSRISARTSIHYDNFDWHIYTTDHFEIYYYPDIEKHLERVAGYAESAYQQVSADLKHDLSFKVPLILFKTHSEFEQENVVPGAAQEGVAAFAEPFRQRMLLPIDDPLGPAVRADHARAHPPVRVRHHPAGTDPPERPAVGQRRTVGLRARPVGSDRPDDDPRRRRRRHRAQDDRARGIREQLAIRASSTTSVTRSSNSSKRSTARKASGSSSSRCARASSAAAKTRTRKRSG